MNPSEPSGLSAWLPTLPDYVELHCISNFTFLTGASHPVELIERAFQLGYRGIALTDECSVAGTARAHDAIKTLRQRLADAVKRCEAAASDAQDEGELNVLKAHAAAADAFRLLIGSRFSLSAPSGADERPPLRLILIAQHREGFGNLCELITLGRMRAQKGSYRLHPDDLFAPDPDQAHLRGMPGCLALLLPDYCPDPAQLLEQAQWCREVFGERAWIALEQLQGHADALHRARLESVSAQAGVPLVAAGAVTMHVRSRKPLSDVLTAIRLGRPLPECGMALAPNAEQHLRMRQVLSRLYPGEALAQTLKIAGLCDFSLDTLRYEYPEELVPKGETPISYLRKEVEAGKRVRFPNGLKPEWAKQLEDELVLIEEKQYEHFFLTVHDVVRFARQEGILCQGRGSAANSLVCYCLYITEVSPEQANLLFGRFLSRERDEPPDIDVDFEHQRREEVIQYIYGKYGRDRTALAASLITYRSRSALRDVACAGHRCERGGTGGQGPGVVGERAGLPGPHQPLRSGPRFACGAAVGQPDRAVAGFPAPPVTARGRFRDGTRQAVAAGADRKRGHGKAQRDPVGQGRPRIAGPAQGRRAGAGHAVGHPPRARDDSESGR